MAYTYDEYGRILGLDANDDYGQLQTNPQMQSGIPGAFAGQNVGFDENIGFTSGPTQARQRATQSLASVGMNGATGTSTQYAADAQRMSALRQAAAITAQTQLATAQDNADPYVRGLRGLVTRNQLLDQINGTATSGGVAQARANATLGAKTPELLPGQNKYAIEGDAPDPSEWYASTHGGDPVDINIRPTQALLDAREKAATAKETLALDPQGRVRAAQFRAEVAAAKPGSLGYADKVGASTSYEANLSKTATVAKRINTLESIEEPTTADQKELDTLRNIQEANKAERTRLEAKIGIAPQPGIGDALGALFGGAAKASVDESKGAKKYDSDVNDAVARLRIKYPNEPEAQLRAHAEQFVKNLKK